MRTLRKSIVALTAFVALCLSPWLIGTTYVNLAGIAVQGEVIEKKEAFVMPGEDRWRHVFEIRYRYRPLDSSYPETAAHLVDPSLYNRLHVGSNVRILYSPWRPLRMVVGMGSFLADTTWLSRISFLSGSIRGLLELTSLAICLLLGFLAYRWKSQQLAMVAGFLGAVWVAGVLLAGFFVFPLLLGLWRRNPGAGFGWVLAGSMALSPPVIYWRLPTPTVMPPGPTREVQGVVRNLRTVDQIWTGREEGGQPLRRPFQMVDLEFTPAGASEPVHVLDRVDLNSLAGLREGAAVRVEYSPDAPRTARIAGGTRTYAEDALAYILGLTYAIGALVVLVGWPAVKFAEGVRRRILGLAAQVQMPFDDPRRKSLEAFLRQRQDEQARTSRRAN